MDRASRSSSRATRRWRAILSFYVKGIIVVAIVAVIASLVGAGDAARHGDRHRRRRGGRPRRADPPDRDPLHDHHAALNIKHGIVSRDVQETKIERVQDVNYRQTVFQRMLQIGDVDFDTAAENSASDFIFAGVANPEEVVDRVHHATEPSGPPPRTREEAERRWDSGL